MTPNTASLRRTTAPPQVFAKENLFPVFLALAQHLGELANAEFLRTARHSLPSPVVLAKPGITVRPFQAPNLPIKSRANTEASNISLQAMSSLIRTNYLKARANTKKMPPFRTSIGAFAPNATPRCACSDPGRPFKSRWPIANDARSA